MKKKLRPINSSKLTEKTSSRISSNKNDIFKSTKTPKNSNSLLLNDFLEVK